MTFDLRSWGDSDGFLVADQALPAVKEAGDVTIAGQHVRAIVNYD